MDLKTSYLWMNLRVLNLFGHPLGIWQSEGRWTLWGKGIAPAGKPGNRTPLTGSQKGQGDELPNRGPNTLNHLFMLWYNNWYSVIIFYTDPARIQQCTRISCRRIQMAVSLNTQSRPGCTRRSYGHQLHDLHLLTLDVTLLHITTFILDFVVFITFKI